MQQPHLREIILLDDKVPGGVGHGIVGALQRYAWEMNQRGVADSLLPPEVIQSSYVEYYCQQVQNGNIGQFVINCQWAPHVVNGVKAGLAAIGVRGQSELFDDVVRFVESTKSDLSAALASNEPEGKGAVIRNGQRFQVMPQVSLAKFDDGVFGKILAEAMEDGAKPGQREAYRKRLDAIRGGFFKAFVAHPGGYEEGSEQLRAANAKWIRSWRNVKLVGPAQYAQELDRIAATISVSRPSGKRPKGPLH